MTFVSVMTIISLFLFASSKESLSSDFLVFCSFMDNPWIFWQNTVRFFIGDFLRVLALGWVYGVGKVCKVQFEDVARVVV